MPDFAQPSDVMWSNPYLMPAPQPDKLSVLANILTGLGAGMSNAAASGRSEWAGIGPGAMLGSQLNANMQQRLEMEQMKKQQAALQWMAFQDKQQERERKRQAIAALGPALFNVQPDGSPQIMPPSAYGPRVAGYEGGSKNGGMVYNELGSGAYGPYQFMPSTWGDVRASNPDLNLPADMTQATRQQHDAAFERFSRGNAQILQKAGFQATPENLYLAHRFGAGGATALLNAKDDALLADVLPREWQAQNPDMRGQTVAGFKRLAGERMRGVGVPYQANGETTQYTLQPDSLPPFAGIPGGTGIQPGANPTPGLTMTPVGVPVAPTPLQPPQAAPGSPQMPVTPVQATLEPPRPPVVPKPMLPPAEAVRIQKLVQAEVLTPEQGLAERNRVINDIWTAQKDQARLGYEQQMKAWELQYGDQRKIEAEKRDQERKIAEEERAANREGEWVRDPETNKERWVTKAERKSGMVRADKPKEVDPGSEAADWATLAKGQADREFAKTPEYAAAYSRRSQRPITVGGGAMVSPDMRYFPPPTAEVVNPEGSPRVTGEKAYTESQGRDHTYAVRLNEAIPQLEAMVKGKDGKYSTENLPSSAARMLADNSYVPDSFVSERAKDFRRVVRDIVTATLRRESGASIAPSEFVSEYAKFIPQANDTDKQIRDKLNALKAAARSIAEATGRQPSVYPNLFGDGGQPTEQKPIPIDISGKRR